MTATAIREAARVAVLIVVLVLAAVLGLVVGNALQDRSTAGVGAPAPDAAAAGTPSYADPQYQRMRHAALAEQIDGSGNNASVTAPTPR